MYKCIECGFTFEEPDYYDEAIGEYHGTPAIQRFYVCPNCKSDDYIDMDEEDDGYDQD